MNIHVPKVARYIIAGGTAATINIGTLFLLTHFIGVWYLLSSIIAFIVSFFISFYLQRTWTFEHNHPDTIARHMVLYFGVTLFNLALNTGIVYALVEWVSVWYVLAQIIAGALVAISSFFIYKHVIFVEPKDASV